MIVFLAALHALPGEVLGAAELDNCGWLAKLVYIIIPMLRPTLVNLLVLSFIGKMMIFDLVWIMTRGGPCGRPRRYRPTSTSARSTGTHSTSAIRRRSRCYGSSSSSPLSLS